ncbi:hypothetical protein ACQP0I_23985 [Micromonospora carbonacea]|uniref:hypothetical protein n=1 Tax=Micromonospora carbonacea TaxID=47853 RepID=UPI003D987CAE
MALTGAGLNTQSATSRLPLGLQVAMCRLFIRTPIGRTMAELLPTTLDETTPSSSPLRSPRSGPGRETVVAVSVPAGGP